MKGLRLANCFQKKTHVIVLTKKTRQAAIGTSGNSGDSKTGESLLDSWLMDMSNQRQYMQVLDKNDLSSDESLDGETPHHTETKNEICKGYFLRTKNTTKKKLLC
jgi:hypothetical protein